MIPNFYTGTIVTQSNAMHGSHSFCDIHAVIDGKKGGNKGESMKTIIQNIDLNLILV